MDLVTKQVCNYLQLTAKYLPIKAVMHPFLVVNPWCLKVNLLKVGRYSSNKSSINWHQTPVKCALFTILLFRILQLQLLLMLILLFLFTRLLLVLVLLLLLLLLFTILVFTIASTYYILAWKETNRSCPSLVRGNLSCANGTLHSK